MLALEIIKESLEATKAALEKSMENLDEGNYIEAEYWLGNTKRLLLNAWEPLSDWADKQDAEENYSPEEEVILPKHSKFFVLWRNGTISEEDYWCGLCLEFGPSQTLARLFSNHRIEVVERHNYMGTRGAKWFMTREEAEAEKKKRGKEKSNG